MKKINILKAIVDFVFICTTPLILVCITLAIGVFVIDLSDLNLTINSINYIPNDIFSNILISISSLNYLLIIAALYFFRKVLHYFLRVKIFEDYVINSFLKIGNLLLASGIISLVISFVSNLYVKSEIHFDFGLNQHILIICLGLFFMILSEIFKMAKNVKQENDLTI